MRASTLFVLLAFGCSDDGSSTTDEDADTAVEADTDTDTDTDTDVDADSDADSDADTDADPQPCPFSVPSTAVVQDGGSLNSQADNQENWLCERTTLTIAAESNTVYAEPRADVIVTQGSGHVIYMTSANSEVLLGTGGNTVYYPSGTTVNEFNGGTNTLIECPAGVVFDYTNAPGGGC